MFSVLYTGWSRSSALGRLSTSDAVDPTFLPAAVRLGRSDCPCSLGRSHLEIQEELAIAFSQLRQSSPCTAWPTWARRAVVTIATDGREAGVEVVQETYPDTRRDSGGRRGCEGKSECGGEADSEGRATRGSDDGGRGCS
jgi:hypothetical protein